MAGTIVTDRIESDASYASSVNIASPLVVSNTISMTNGSITGNVNFDSGTLFVDAPGNKVGVGTNTPLQKLDIFGNAIRMDNGSYIGYIGSQLALNASGGASDFTVRSDNALTFSSGGPYERMRIDTSGRVTKPNNPAFRAKADVNIDNITQGSLVPFRTIVFDKNNNYNTSTSRFTAPVAGVYFFSAAVYTMTNVGVNGSLAMNKNGTFFAVGELHNVSGNLGYGMLTIACCTELAVNDYVDLSMRISSGHLNSNFNNYFSGFLVG
jgi:hypothetical protein